MLSADKEELEALLSEDAHLPRLCMIPGPLQRRTEKEEPPPSNRPPHWNKSATVYSLFYSASFAKGDRFYTNNEAFLGLGCQPVFPLSQPFGGGRSCSASDGTQDCNFPKLLVSSSRIELAVHSSPQQPRAGCLDSESSQDTLRGDPMPGPSRGLRMRSHRSLPLVCSWRTRRPHMFPWPLAHGPQASVLRTGNGQHPTVPPESHGPAEASTFMRALHSLHRATLFYLSGSCRSFTMQFLSYLS